MKIQWTEDLATGVALIDEQHQELFARVAGLVNAVGEGNPNQVEDLVNFLIDYVVEHFGTEEKYMIKFSYDQYESHRDEHSAFVKKIYHVRRNINTQGIDNVLTSQLVADVVDWLVNHIQVRDKRLATIGEALTA